MCRGRYGLVGEQIGDGWADVGLVGDQEGCVEVDMGWLGNRLEMDGQMWG